ncbi:MAG TPA: hypothetical protein PKZ25_01120 [Candidatus Hydrogenedentes bacterium]|nr:hypothetical protein [Candidatus Hydrogenedentota bacterium]
MIDGRGALDARPGTLTIDHGPVCPPVALALHRLVTLRSIAEKAAPNMDILP